MKDPISSCSSTTESYISLHRFSFVLSLFLTVMFFAVAAMAQSDTVSVVDRSEFESSARDLSTIDFERTAPARGGFGKYPVDEGLSVNGVEFRTSGGGRFGPGMILVLSQPYAVSNPMYNTG